MVEQHQSDTQHRHLDLDQEDLIPSFSDDLEALYEQEAELVITRNRKGVVIQHRRHRLPDAFRSEDDRPFAIPSSQPLQYREGELGNSSPNVEITPISTSKKLLGSRMPYLSSPVAYPPSSSPPLLASPKRKRPDHQRLPLKETAANKQTSAIFIEESDSDEDDVDVEDLQVLPISPSKRPRIDDGYAKMPSVNDPNRNSETNASISHITSTFKLPATNLTAASELPQLGSSALLGSSTYLKTTSGKNFNIPQRRTKSRVSYEQLIAERSRADPGKARRSYYGIEIHSLLDEANSEIELRDATAAPAVEILPTLEPQMSHKARKNLMWTEKYRARKFTDLIGDDRTHRSVMHWLKRWDQIVFPGSARPKIRASKTGDNQQAEERPHKKVLLLTGPPGLGKTTLAHVCAKQAGYEVQEINASDERSKDVVKGRIRDMVGTENVKGVDVKTVNGVMRKAGRPVCVIVDEVDGVVGGSGGSGEGGFVKALIDLVLLDQKSSRPSPSQQTTNTTRKKKGENFRMMRPLVLICNDVYHNSLRPLRQSGLAEIIHVGKPQLSTVISRMQSIFDKENIPADSDGVRRLCEASWGVTSRKEGGSGYGTGEGDIRSIMVVGEWVAGRIRATLDATALSMQRLTRRWIEANVLEDLGQGSGAARGLGRGGSKEIVERVFQEGAGLSKSTFGTESVTPAGITGVKGVAEADKARAIHRLRELINGFGDTDRVMTDCFTAYPDQPFQDDTFLSKPSQAYDWLHFHDALSSAVFSTSEWELAPYLSQSVLAFHHLFATSSATKNRRGVSNPWDKAQNEDGTEEEPLPFTGPQASFAAHEAQKANHALLQGLQSNLSLPLTRLFPSTPDLATDLLPYLLRMTAPSINPTVISTPGADKYATTASVRKASEKNLLTRSVNALLATGVRFERTRIESSFDTPLAGPTTQPQNQGWVYRMEPALDTLGTFATGGKTFCAETRGPGSRFAVRQALEQELRREEKQLADNGRKKRWAQGGDGETYDEVFANAAASSQAKEVEKERIRRDAGRKKLKRDFFGRVVADGDEERGFVGMERGGEREAEARKRVRAKLVEVEMEGRVWISFHEGFSNAVRKPISLKELMKGL